jgi:membrane protease YdiL (CAAX protease family)
MEDTQREGMSFKENIIAECREVFVIVRETYDHLKTREGIILMSTLLGVMIWGPKGTPIFSEFLTSWLKAIPAEELWRDQILSFITGSVVLVVVPICIIKFVLHERLADFGLGLGNFKLGSALTLVLILVSIPLFCFGSSSESMRVEYPMLYRGLTDAARIQRFNGGSFVLYEATYALFFLTIEFIFRGYLLFGLSRRFGRYAVLFQMLSYTAWHLVKPLPELSGTLLWGFATAAVTLRARSIWYVFAAHYLLNIFLDCMILHGQGVF